MYKQNQCRFHKYCVHRLRIKLRRDLEKFEGNTGAVRSEARSKYIERVYEATDAALSKHDQVLISAEFTRVGRTKLSTCVACDRPLRNKSKLSIDSQTDKSKVDRKSVIKTRDGK